jgi:TolB protein
VLRIVAGPAPAAAPPSPTPKVVIVPPQDEQSLLALAAIRLTATAETTPYTGDGTPTPPPTATPLPPNWVTPVIITNTPTPETAATAAWRAQIATAQAVVMGTATPLPVNIWTATPTPLAPTETPTPPFVLYDDLTPTATATATPTGVPGYLRGKILFLSDRTGNPQGELMFMNPDGSEQAILTAPDNWVYAVSRQGQDTAPDGRFRVLVSDQQLDGVPDNKLPNFALFVAPLQEQGRPLRISPDGANYDAVWSPSEYLIAFVSTVTGNDEIYTVRPDGSELTRLTFNEWEWDKHPNWSPDGTQLVFWSNRGAARSQIWIMNADGGDQRNLSNNEFNDWDPVWVR